MSRKKIAILGGGMGALSAAFWLTEKPGWQQEYEIDLYQMGWRLGGKGASGRNLDEQDRIEEHGLHVWGGYYENSFRTMRKCYQELNRPPGHPLSSIEDAFKKQSFITLMEYVHDKWIPWNFNTWDPSCIGGMPGEERSLPSISDYIYLLVELTEQIRDAIKERLNSITLGEHTGPGLGELVRSLGSSGLNRLVEGRHLPDVRALCKTLRWDLPEGPADLQRVVDLLQGILALVRRSVEDLIDMDDHLRRLWMMLDISVGIATGMINDEVYKNGYDSINKYDWAEWLSRHGVGDLAVKSALVRAVYDTFFAYRGGDPSGEESRAMAAGAALYAVLRFIFTSRGSLFWEMQAGMGETVFAPLYIALRKRGVRFHFFCRVESLGLSEDKRQIASIHIKRQATIKKEADPGDNKEVETGEGEYYPLVNVNGVPCWPTSPRYDRIVEGDELRRAGINLESPWSPWAGVLKETLTVGNDFDLVILGVSIGAFGDICKPLIDHSSKWRKMFSETETVHTQGAQFWLAPEAPALGWPYSKTVLTAFADPLDSWGDFSHLVKQESWPAAATPGSLAYFCGVMNTPPVIPAYSDYEFPRRQKELAEKTVVDLLRNKVASLWPRAIDPASGDFNWSLLVDPKGRAGIERLKAQFWCANVNPSDRYVLSVPASMDYRLKADDSGFENLYLAGDWVHTPLNLGCMEAACMAGMQASQTICRYPERIIGWDVYGHSVARLLDAKLDGHGLPAIRPLSRGRGNMLSGIRRFIREFIAKITGRKSRVLANGNPPYAILNGMDDIDHPMMLEEVSFYIFIMRSNLRALQSLCDEYINNVTGGEVRVMPFMPVVLLGSAFIGKGRSMNPPASRMGWMSEIDIAFWVPVAVLTPSGCHLAWMIPYVFVDKDIPVTLGREIFGFRKQLGNMVMPIRPGDSARFSVEALAIPKYDSTSEIKTHRILEVMRTDSRDVEPPVEPWTNAAQAYEGFIKNLTDPTHAQINPELLINKVAVTLARAPGIPLASMPIIFLKQIRDSEDGKKACYQAVVEVMPVVTSFSSGGLLSGDYQIRVNEFESHPILQHLGLAGGSQKALRAMNVNFSFHLGKGSVIWKAR